MLPSFSYQKDELPNGLRVVTIELPHLHTAALVVYSRAGARYESTEESGLSHFVEHMLFRGTTNHPSSWELNFAIEELGGTLYAETGRDYSLFQISLHPSLVDQGMSLLGEIFTAPTFSQLEVERELIIEEINEDLDERGNDIDVDDLAHATAFPKHPLGQKITGPLSNVERFKLDDIRDHFSTLYGASNMVLTVAGPVERARMLELAATSFGALPKGQLRTVAAPDEMTDGPRLAYVRNPGAQTSVQVLLRAFPERDPRYPALQTLSRILDDGMSTRLHYTLCDQLGLAYSVGACIEPFQDCALFELDGATAHAKVAELLERALELLSKLGSDPVSDAEILKAKRRYRYDLYAALDDAEAMAGWFGGTELFYPPPGFAEKLARIEAVTSDDVRQAAQAIFQPQRLVVATSGLLGSKQRRDIERVVKKWR
ncbi:MAG: pitrilysin family protein [Pseudomonadota bacterium]